MLLVLNVFPHIVELNPFLKVLLELSFLGEGNFVLITVLTVKELLIVHETHICMESNESLLSFPIRLAILKFLLRSSLYVG